MADSWRPLAVAIRLKDIALEAGYSVNTVSLALRGSSRVKEATREKIVLTANKAHYVRNNVARSLVTQKTMTVGVILTDITSPILTSVAQNIERLLTFYGYAMVLATTDERLDQEKRAVDVLRAQKVDGMLIFPAYHDKLEHLAPLEEAGYPLVLLSGNRTAAFDLVSMDETLGAYKATQHLVSLGHTQIALLSAGSDKLEGYRRALEEANLFDASLVIEAGGTDHEHGYRAVTAIAQLEQRPTALLAATDYLALGAISWCKTNNIRIPEDLAVIGFDDIEAAKYSDPTLSSVTYDAAYVSERAVTRLLERISQTQSSTYNYRTEKIIIRPELALRRSSASSSLSLTDRTHSPKEI